MIEAVSAAGNPIGNNNLGGNGYNFENSDGTFSANSKMVEELMVDADYLETMEIKLLHGRYFSNDMPTDQYGAASFISKETNYLHFTMNNRFCLTNAARSFLM